MSAYSCTSHLFVFDAKACLKQTRSSDKYFFQTDTPSALGGSAIEKDYSPLYLPNPLPPPASSIFPPFLLPSLPLRFPLQIFPFSSCHCVQFVPEISPSNKGQIMTKRLCYCVYAIVCACLCLFPCFLFMDISCTTEFPRLYYQLLHISTLFVLLHLRVALHDVTILYDFFSTFLPVRLCFTGSASPHQSVTGR